MTNDDRKIGENVQRLRKAAGLSQGELAASMTKLGFPMQQQTVLKIEKGQRPLRLAEARHMAGSLGVMIEELVELQYTDEEFELIRLDRELSEAYLLMARSVLTFQAQLDAVRAALGDRDAAAWLSPSHQKLLNAELQDILRAVVDPVVAKELGLIQFELRDERDG